MQSFCLIEIKMQSLLDKICKANYTKHAKRAWQKNKRNYENEN